MSSIIQEVMGYGFDVEIATKAGELFISYGTPNRRKNQRLMMIFNIVYHAHKHLSRDTDYTLICKKIGMDPKLATTALARYSRTQTGFCPHPKPVATSSVTSVVSEYCKMMGLSDETTEEFAKKSSEIVAKSSVLRNETSNKVAYAILLYLLKTNGMEIRNLDCKETFSLSSATIKNVFHEVCKVDNSVDETLVCNEIL